MTYFDNFAIFLRTLNIRLVSASSTPVSVTAATLKNAAAVISDRKLELFNPPAPVCIAAISPHLLNHDHPRHLRPLPCHACRILTTPTTDAALAVGWKISCIGTVTSLSKLLVPGAPNSSPAPPMHWRVNKEKVMECSLPSVTYSVTRATSRLGQLVWCALLGRMTIPTTSSDTL